MLASALERRLPARALGLVSVACVAVLTAGSAVAVTRGGDTSRPATRRTAATPSPTASPSPTPSPKPSAPVDFLVPLDTKAPAYERVPDKVAGAGPIDLAKAAAIDSGHHTPTAADKKTMKDLGFRRGYSRAWDDGQRTIVVYVYEWSTSASARAFLAGVRVVHERAGDLWTPTTPHSVGSCRISDGDAVDSEVVQVGRHTFIVAAIRDGSCRRHTDVQKVANLQYDFAVKHRA
jgi:hypothetical protein